MSDDTKKGLLRVGADFFGGPVDTVVSLLNQLSPPTGGGARRLASRAGLMAEEQGQLDSKQMVGSSDFIAEKAGIQGDSPEYQRARMAGNLGLMLTPWAVKTVKEFNPRQGDLNMWIGPKARTYDKDKADDTFRNFKQSFSGQLKASEIDDFNEAELIRNHSIVDPYTKKVLQYRPDLTILSDADANNLISYTFKNDGLEVPLHAILKKEGNLGEYPGLAQMGVQLSADPSSPLGSFDPISKKFTLNPVRASSTIPYMPGAGIDQTLRHEITHAVQQAEGLPSGGNPDRVRFLAGLMRDELKAAGVDLDLMGGDPFVRIVNQAENDPFRVYKRIAGEVLADNAMNHYPMFNSTPTPLAPKFSSSVALDGSAIVPVSEYLAPGRGPFYRTPGDLTQSSSAGQSQALTEALQRALASRRP